MGLAAVDIPLDQYFLSTNYSSYINPPAIHLILSEDEVLEQKFSLYQGSGGKAASLLNNTPSGANTQIKKETHNKLADTINEICLSFGMTKDELTQVCKIQSRKTLYNWINGETTPRKSAMSRIFDLLLISKAWRNSGFPTGQNYLHEAVVGNQSVFDLLQQPEIDKERILFAGSRLNLFFLEKNSLSDPFS
jgi:hypothetical protein